MKYIFAMLLLSTITIAIPNDVEPVNVDLNLIHQENTAGVSPIIFEPGPVIDEIFVTPTPTPTITPTDTNTLILYDTNNNNRDINGVIENPPPSFVIEQNSQQVNQQHKPNKLFPNTPLY